MSKLTKEYFTYMCDGQRIWNLIQEHTAECVAEAVAEAIKHRYQLGERLEVKSDFGGWRACFVQISDGKHVVYGEVRRPPRTRKMTDKELMQAVYDKLHGVWSDVEKLSRPTLEAMAKDLNISIEVEVG